jgi:flagellar hook-associated protein 2
VLPAWPRWTQFQTLVKTLNTSAVALRDGAIGSVLATGGTTVGGRALLQATAANGAAPGDYETEVMSLARASKMGGAPVASSNTALGLSGDFFVNGKRIVVAATDTLAKIRDTINAANTGSTGSGVAASINTTSGGVRLVLAASATGSSGIELTDGTTEILKQLGLVDGSATSAVAQPQSFRFTSSSIAIASVLGVSPVPAVTSITVGNTTIAVDLSTDTLAGIRQRIAAAGVDANIATETFNGASWRVGPGEPVGAVPGDADSARVAAPSASRTGQSSVTQVLADASPWTDGGGAATAATALSSLSVGGTAISLVAGDTIQINGTRGDGVAVVKTLTLDGTETVNSLLAVLNDASAFGQQRCATAHCRGRHTNATDETAGSRSSPAFCPRERRNRESWDTYNADHRLCRVRPERPAVRIDGTMYTRSSARCRRDPTSR